MLGHHPRRLASIKPALGEQIVCSLIGTYYCTGLYLLTQLFLNIQLPQSTE